MLPSAERLSRGTANPGEGFDGLFSGGGMDADDRTGVIRARSRMELRESNHAHGPVCVDGAAAGAAAGAVVTGTMICRVTGT